MKYLVYTLLAFSATGCFFDKPEPLQADTTPAANPAPPAKTAAPAANLPPAGPVIAAADSAFTLDSFDGFPPEIDGCSCYFSQTKEENDARRYIFVTNYDSMAFATINGKREKLKLTATTGDESTQEGIVQVFSNEKWTVRVSGKSRRTGDEVWEYTGKIWVTKTGENAETLVVEYIGECGC